MEDQYLMSSWRDSKQTRLLSCWEPASVRDGHGKHSCHHLLLLLVYKCEEAVGGTAVMPVCLVTTVGLTLQTR